MIRKHCLVLNVYFFCIKICKYSVVAPRTATLSSEEGIGSADKVLEKSAYTSSAGSVRSDAPMAGNQQHTSSVGW